MKRVRGTDLAMFQGEPDFAAFARDESLAFALVKATEGQGYCDPKWERNLSLTPHAFEFVSCYHVTRGTSGGALQAEHGGRQWERLANIASRTGARMLPPVIDFEITDKRPAEWLIENTVAYRTRIEAITGRVPILYSYPSFLRDQCGDLAPPELVECWHWPALYVGKKWADVAGGFDPYEWLRARKVTGSKTGSQLPAMWSRAPWALYQYDGDKGEFYKGVDYDFNAAASRDVLLEMSGRPSDAPPDTLPETIEGRRTKSSQNMQAVREHIADLSLTSPATRLLDERPEVLHTVDPEDVDLGH